MAVIGSLVVDLKADVARFSSDLAKARGDISRVGTSVSQVNGQLATFGRTLRSAFGALGIGIGVRELANLVRGALEAAGGLGELAEQMGVTTRTLQVLQFAAVQSGVEVGELEAGIQRFSRSIGEAADGNKTYIDTFNKLGVNLLDASGNLRSTDVVLREVSAAIAAIEDPARRAAAAADLFGRGGVKLLPILNLGETGFNEFAAAAEAAGVVLTDQMVKDADAAGDAIARLEFAVTRWWQKMVIEGIPKVTEFVDATKKEFAFLDQLATDVDSFVTKVIASFGRIKEAGKAGDITDTLDQILSELGFPGGVAVDRHPMTIGIGSGVPGGAPSGGLPSMLPSGNVMNLPAPPGVSNPPSTGGGGTKRDSAAEAIKALRFELEQLGRTAREQDIFSALEKAGVSMGSAVGQQIVALVEQIHNTKLGQDAANESFQRGLEIATAEDEARAAASERAKEIIAQRDQLLAGFGREIEDRQALLEAIQQGAEAYELEARFQEIANQFREQGMPLYGQEVENVRALVGQMRELDKQVEGIKALREEAQEFGKTLSEDIAGGLADAISGTKSWEDVLLELFETIAREIGKILEMQSQDSGDGGIGGFIGDLLEGIFGGGSSSGPSSGGFMGTGIGGLASGTSSASPGWHMVGEAGPEALRFRGGEQVIPNRALGGGGGDVEVNIINQSGGETEVRQRRGNDGRRIVEVMVRAVADNIRSGGEVAQAQVQRFGLTMQPGFAR